MEIETAHGVSTKIDRLIPDTYEQVQFVRVATIEREDFDRCPICLEPSPTSAEHVPPRSLGGSVLTLTCDRCNNEFGSKVEVHLLDWFEDAVHVRFGSESVPGDRRSPRILLRQNQDGAPVFIIDSGRIDPRISELLRSGDFSMLVRDIDVQRVKVAALKSAYLAACVLMSEIIDTPLAQQIRQILLEARDAPRDALLPAHPVVDNLRIARSYAAGTSEVALVARPSDTGPTEFTISLAGVLGVSWPLEPIAVTPIQPQDSTQERQ